MPTNERAEPGSKGGGEYYRIILHPDEDFVTFRYHDVGDEGHLQRLAGRRKDGSWETQAWLISKDDAHVRDGKLIADSKDAKELLKELDGKIVHHEGDIFKLKG